MAGRSHGGGGQPPPPAEAAGADPTDDAPASAPGVAMASIDGLLVALVAQVERAERTLVNEPSMNAETARELLVRAKQDVERARVALKLVQVRGGVVGVVEPAARSEVASLGRLPEPRAASADAFRVAVVDDDAGARKLVVRWLTGARFACIEYRSGSEAVEALEAAPDYVDAVVLDVMMPGLDGFGVLRRLKDNPATAAIPIIMLTAHATGEADIATGVEGGAADFITKPFSGPVLVAKVRAVSEKHGAERRLRAQLRSAEEKAMTDSLTDLLNRRAFERSLVERTAQAVRSQEPLGLVLLDLDHFKRINDTSGHEAGDRILVHFARALRRVLRAGDQAFRYGGEEFALLLPRCGAEDAARILARVRAELVERTVSVGSARELVVRFSAGVATAEAKNGHRVDALVGRADAALYRAKSAGRDRTEIEGDAPTPG